MRSASGCSRRIVHLVCSVATSICITWGTLQALSRRKPEWEPILRQVRGPLFGRLLALGCIQYFIIGLSAILLIPPLFLLPLWAVTIPVMMIERTDIGAAFNRSIDLTRYRRLPILGTFLLAALIFIAGAAVIVLLLGHGPVAHLVLLAMPPSRPPWSAAAGDLLRAAARREGRRDRRSDRGSARLALAPFR